MARRVKRKMKRIFSECMSSVCYGVSSFPAGGTKSENDGVSPFPVSAMTNPNLSGSFLLCFNTGTAFE